MSTASTTTIETTVTVVLGHLPGWFARLVYRSTGPVPVTISADRRFLTLSMRGEQMVGAIVTPEGLSEPVVYLGGGLPVQPWTLDEGWQSVDMPRGVISEVVETDVLALSWQDGELVGRYGTVWLDRVFRPMERLELPSQQVDGPTHVRCRVLQSADDKVPLPGCGGALRHMVVAVDDLADLPTIERTTVEWTPADWVAISSCAWRSLNDLSQCIESVTFPLLGNAILGEVIVHDVEALNKDDLHLLPSDVRYGLEFALLTMPD